MKNVRNGKKPSTADNGKRSLAVKAHYSASELAAMRLPELPTSVSGIFRAARRDSWAFKTRVARGGGLEYALTSLPAGAQAEIKRLAAELLLTQIGPTTPQVEGHLVAADGMGTNKRLSLTTAERESEDARRVVLIAARELIAKCEISMEAALTTLLTKAKLGELNSSLDRALRTGRDGRGRKGKGNGVPCLRTLKRWLEKERNDELAPKIPQPNMSVPAWAPCLLSILQRPQKPSLAAAHRLMAGALPAGVIMPSYWVVQRWYSDKYSSLDKQRGRNTGSALNPYKFHHTRTSAGMLPLQEVHSDGWCTKFLAPHPISSKYVTFEVWHSHDVATRFAFEPAVGLSESTLVVMECLANVVRVGVPAVWQTDNTSSVKNDRIEFDPVTSISARAGIFISHTVPGNSQANGIAENFNRYLDSRARELATYTGKAMDPLTKKRMRKLTQQMVDAADNDARAALKREAERVGAGCVFDSFAQAVDWLKRITAEYNDMPHRGLSKITDPATGKHRRQSPREAWMAHQASGWEPVSVSKDELADLFRLHEIKTVRRGKVRLYGQEYHHPELDHLDGDQVQVAYDLSDGECVWIKDGDGRLICEAAFYSPRGYRAQSFYEMAYEKRADAAIKRHEGHIAEIEAQRPGLVIEHQKGATTPGIELNRPQTSIAAPIELNPIASSTSSGRRTLPTTWDTASPIEPVAVERPDLRAQESRWDRWWHIESERQQCNWAEMPAGEADMTFWRQYQKSSEFKARLSTDGVPASMVGDVRAP